MRQQMRNSLRTAGPRQTCPTRNACRCARRQDRHGSGSTKAADFAEQCCPIRSRIQDHGFQENKSTSGSGRAVRPETAEAKRPRRSISMGWSGGGLEHHWQCGVVQLSQTALEGQLCANIRRATASELMATRYVLEEMAHINDTMTAPKGSGSFLDLTVQRAPNDFRMSIMHRRGEGEQLRTMTSQCRRRSRRQKRQRHRQSSSISRVCRFLRRARRFLLHRVQQPRVDKVNPRPRPQVEESTHLLCRFQEAPVMIAMSIWPSCRSRR